MSAKRTKTKSKSNFHSLLNRYHLRIRHTLEVHGFSQADGEQGWRLFQQYREAHGKEIAQQELAAARNWHEQSRRWFAIIDAMYRRDCLAFQAVLIMLVLRAYESIADNAPLLVAWEPTEVSVKARPVANAIELGTWLRVKAALRVWTRRKARTRD